MDASRLYDIPVRKKYLKYVWGLWSIEQVMLLSRLLADLTVVSLMRSVKRWQEVA